MPLLHTADAADEGRHWPPPTHYITPLSATDAWLIRLARLSMKRAATLLLCHTAISAELMGCC